MLIMKKRVTIIVLIFVLIIGFFIYKSFKIKNNFFAYITKGSVYPKRVIASTLKSNYDNN
jgi:uncharacterized protein YxeA